MQRENCITAITGAQGIGKKEHLLKIAIKHVKQQRILYDQCYSHCDIHNKADLLEKNIPFSPIKYSKFKFGDKTTAKKFGYDLAEGFILNYLSQHIKYLSQKQIVVVSSPYCFIPTATFAMKDYFIQYLNNWLIQYDLPVVQETKIHRNITYTEDYGGLSSEEREKLIGKDGFYIDKEFIKNKLVLYMDDIKITGSHEKVIRKMIKDQALEHDYIFIYYAQLMNKEIHPSIENDLNYAYVKSLLDLDKIIKNDNFLLNTRVVKYILNASFSQFSTFIQFQSQKFCQTVYHLAIGNSYHKIDSYKNNFEYLKSHISNDRKSI